MSGVAERLNLYKKRHDLEKRAETFEGKRKKNV